VINRASELAHAHHLQLWDGVVCAASAQAGATVLATEDMQDGRVLEGLRLINPFLATNNTALEGLLPM
jgi:predicted nucleic acid-binding protein